MKTYELLNIASIVLMIQNYIDPFEYHKIQSHLRFIWWFKLEDRKIGLDWKILLAIILAFIITVLSGI